jgi:hypothetical protein
LKVVRTLPHLLPGLVVFLCERGHHNETIEQEEACPELRLRLQLKNLIWFRAAYLYALPSHQGDEGSLRRAVGS